MACTNTSWIFIIIVIFLIVWLLFRERGVKGASCGGQGGGPKGSDLNLYNSILEPSHFPLSRLSAQPNQLPLQFDEWRAQNMLLTPRDQEQCGSCWAFSTVTVLANRISIATRGNYKQDLSAQYLVSCDEAASACDGASSLSRVFGSMTYQGTGLPGKPGGTVKESVYRYDPSNANPTGQNTSCIPLPPNSLMYDFIDGSVKSLSESDATGSMTPQQLQANILRIKTDVMLNGPVSACFAVYSDFDSFNSTNRTAVYRVSPTAKLTGYHAVSIAGWGVEDGSNTPYWICINSWGTDWGDNGYWYHAIGDNKTFIESNCHSAIPKMASNSELTAVTQSLAQRGISLRPFTA
jgi:cathepsin B